MSWCSQWLLYASGGMTGKALERWVLLGCLASADQGWGQGNLLLVLLSNGLKSKSDLLLIPLPCFCLPSFENGFAGRNGNFHPETLSVPHRSPWSCMVPR